MLDLYSDQIEEDFPQNAILKIVDRPCKLKLYVKAIFDSHFHLQWFVSRWLNRQRIEYNELLFLGNAIVTSIDYDMNIVSIANVLRQKFANLPKSDDDAIVCFELLLYSVERKIVFYRVSKRPWCFKFLP